MNVPSYPGAAEQICNLKPGSFYCGNDAWFHRAQSFTLQLLIFLFYDKTRQSHQHWNYFNNFLQNCRMNEKNPLSVRSVLLSIFVLVLKSSIQHCLKTNPFPFHWGKTLMSVTQRLWVPFFLLKEISTEQSLFYHSWALIRPSPFILLPSPAIVETDILPKASKSAICCCFCGASGILPAPPWGGPRCDCFFCATLKISGGNKGQLQPQRPALPLLSGMYSARC